MDRVHPRDFNYYLDLGKSENFQDRMIAEYQTLKIRYEKLNQFIEDFRNKTCKFTPKCRITLLKWQANIMESYMQVLVDIAREEKIDLNKYE